MKKRNIRTFEADADVDQMLQIAVKSGLKLKEILNRAMREHGKRVIRDLASSHRKALDSITFNSPEYQLARAA